MKKFNLMLFGSIYLASAMATAAVNLKHGLWEINTTTTVNGKEKDSFKEINSAMQKVKPAQQKQMEKMLAAKGVYVGENGLKVCSEKNAIDEKFARGTQKDCTVKNQENLADGIKYSFQCKDGTGTAEFHQTSDTDYRGFNEFETKKGKSRTEFVGKFLASDCGDIKPMKKVK